MATPSEGPPSYQEVSGSSQRPVSSSTTNAIPAQERRSMEDMNRPLPEGWIRQWDPTSHHHFYVDTRQNPPRSIWYHPFDEHSGGNGKPYEQPQQQQPQLQQDQLHAYDDTTDEEGNLQEADRKSKPPATGMKKLGQQMKNKMTNSTHEERVAKRKEQRRLEQKAYEQHQAIRAILVKASQTGQPQLVGRDKRGRDIYAQPPPRSNPYAGPQLGYTPYQTEHSMYGPGSYAAPMGPYGRRPGYGYGGGMGMPLMGGMAGGMLLGGLLF